MDYKPNKIKYRTYEDAYNSGTPTLTYLDITYGEKSSLVWLIPYISKCFGVSGFVNGQITDFMVENTAKSIRDNYYFLNLAEIALFFMLFEGGKFERFFSLPNPQVITQSLLEFCQARQYHISDTMNQKPKEKEQGTISYDEWRRMKEAKGEEVHIDFCVKNGEPTITEKKDEKMEAAKMIVENTSRLDFNNLSALRDVYIKKYGEDPYKYYKNRK